MTHPNTTGPTLLQRHLDLLRLEYAYEKESYREQSRQAGVERRVRQGRCWYPLTAGRSFYNSLNQLLIEVERSTDSDEHELEPGRPVCFFDCDMGGTPRFFPFTAQVNFVDGRRMLVAVPSEEAVGQLRTAHDLGVQLYFDETSYQAMFAAMNAVLQAKGNRLAHLRDVLTGLLQPARRVSIPVSLPWLNKSQEAAVVKVLEAKEVAIVHGPPGTGKTTTLVEAIHETLLREAQVMVCAQSNAAVDWIAEKLCERGVNVLRVGNPMRVTDRMLGCTYERRFEAHADYPELWSLRKEIRRLQQRRRDASGAEQDRLHKLHSRATELEIRIDADLFGEARVVASTLIGAANRVVSHRRFSTLFVDEAAQALEAACWNAIQRADRVILAGDHCQLPPTVKSPEASRQGLGVTLMQRLTFLWPQTVALLTMQYRMHADIMRFSSDTFYHGQLTAAPEIANRTILSLDYPMVWYDTDGLGLEESTSEQTQSRLNKAEADLLIDLLKQYIRRTGEERVLDERLDFGIISPYKAQVYYLRTALKRDPFFRRYRRQIAVNTVDGFQGQERDVILISMVRGNDDGKIGFLNDLRRMNVAITRARMKLIILGDSATLGHHAFYRKLYAHIGEFGKVIRLAKD